MLLNVFGSPTKTFRSAFLQVKQSPYIEAARAYGASNRRIIFHYLVPRIIPVLVPQLITLIPGFIFLEATLGIFNIKSNYPTWGRVIYEGLTQGALYGSRYWVLEPLALLLLTGLAFAMMGYALDRILNPRLVEYFSHSPPRRGFNPNSGALRRSGKSAGAITGRAITFSTIQDARILRQTEFWPDPFEPPGWRARWAEKTQSPDKE